MNNRLAVLFIIAFNMAPVAGALFYNWQPFEAFWFFWLETLMIAVFNGIRIVFSQHADPATRQSDTAFTYHLSKGIGYLFTRICIFLFYSIFIIVFIGFIANSQGDKHSVLRTLLFQNRFFNLSLLISFIAQSYYLIFYFFRNGVYISSDPDNFAALFDSRQLIMHVAIILGTFGSLFLVKQTAFGSYSSAVIIGTLCICKCAVELFNHDPRKATDDISAA